MIESGPGLPLAINYLNNYILRINSQERPSKAPSNVLFNRNKYEI